MVTIRFCFGITETIRTYMNFIRQIQLKLVPLNSQNESTILWVFILVQRTHALNKCDTPLTLKKMYLYGHWNDFMTTI